MVHFGQDSISGSHSIRFRFLKIILRRRNYFESDLSLGFLSFGFSYPKIKFLIECNKMASILTTYGRKLKDKRLKNLGQGASFVAITNHEVSWLYTLSAPYDAPMIHSWRAKADKQPI